MVSFDAADRKKLIHSNQRLTAFIVDACLENSVKKLCHVSSIAALPTSTDGRMITENDGWPKEKNSPYSEGKVKSEYEVWRGIQEGLSAVIVNPSVVIGPGKFNTGTGSIFSTVYKGLKYYPGGSAGFIDVLDVAEIMTGLMNSDIEGERYILNGQNMMFREVLILMAHHLGVNAPSKLISKKTLEKIAFLEKIRSLLTFGRTRISKDGIPAMTHLNSYDSTKIQNALNHTFLPVEGAIERTARYFLDVQRGRN
jgi:nucleoside-diphosphate-sugar epimerase